MATSTDLIDSPDWQLLFAGACYVQVQNDAEMIIQVEDDVPASDDYSGHICNLQTPFTNQTEQTVYIRRVSHNPVHVVNTHEGAL